MEAEAEAEAFLFKMVEAEAEAEAMPFEMVQMEAEAEAVFFQTGLLEAEAEAVQKSTASASLVVIIIIHYCYHCQVLSSLKQYLLFLIHTRNMRCL